MNNGKKFDVCLMNPPYGNLHLKFLSKSIECCEDVVSIQPVRWLQDPTAIYSKGKRVDYKKYEDSISKHIKDIEIISASESDINFDAAFTMDLGIYVCNNKGGYNYKSLSENKILNKVLSLMTDNIDNHLEMSVPKNAVIISLITGGNNGRTSLALDLLWTDIERCIYDENGKQLGNGKTFYENRKMSAWGNVQVRAEQQNIKFNNLTECKNFYYYTHSNLFRYIFHITTMDVNVHSKYLPFLSDYSKRWTDEEIYELFNINKDEQREIEETVNNTIKDIEIYLEEEKKKKKKKRNI